MDASERMRRALQALAGPEQRRTVGRCLSRVAVRWYKKQHGEMYAYALAYAVLVLVLVAGLRWLTISTVVTVVVGLVVLFTLRLAQRRRARKVKKSVENVARWVTEEVDHRFLTTDDGVRLHYMVAGEVHRGSESAADRDRRRVKLAASLERDGKGGFVETAREHQPTMLIANGLGCHTYFWRPVLLHFVTAGWRIVTWDYRGLFQSSTPRRPRAMAIHETAKDAIRILDEIGVDVCDVFVGWSTGVQVGLELQCIHPERLDKCVFLNGTHGQVLTTVFQPFFRVPLAADMMHILLEKLLVNVDLLYSVRPMRSMLVFTHNCGWPCC